MPPKKYMEYHAPAKINLTLEILYRRNDGYHQLCTVMQELAYGDIIHLEEAGKGGLDFFCDDPGLPAGTGNLAFRAASLLQAGYAPRRGARITLFKKIPAAAGLGGGSSDAAAVLRGLNQLWQLGLETETLARLAAQLGSDVPFFLYGGTALAEGRGEAISSLPPFPRAFVLLVSPPRAALSTALVYQTLDWDKINSGEKTGNFVQGLMYGGQMDVDELLEHLQGLMVNDLEDAAFKLVRELPPLKEKLQQWGLKPLLSGSGPTMFALSRDAGQLQKAADDLKDQGYDVILSSIKQ